MPERYVEHERQEEALREEIGDVTILVDRAGGGPRRPLSLRSFRERLEAAPTLFDGEEWGGCGCFTPLAYEEAVSS